MSEGELLHHAELIENAISDARGNVKELQDGLSLEEFVVEILVGHHVDQSSSTESWLIHSI